MPLTDAAWALIVASAAGGVQGKAFWMSHPTWFAMQRERARVHRRLYSVPVLFDDAMSFGAITLEKRRART